jgi:hypothetical protein
VTKTAKHTLNTRTARKTTVTTVLAAILRRCTHIALNIMASRRRINQQNGVWDWVWDWQMHVQNWQQQQQQQQHSNKQTTNQSNKQTTNQSTV